MNTVSFSGRCRRRNLHHSDGTYLSSGNSGVHLKSSFPGSAFRALPYNQYAAWYMGRENVLYTLQPDGSWKQRDSGAVIIHVFDGGEPPRVHFTTEGGVMTGMEFHVEMENGESLIAQSYANEMAYSVLAFARAQPAVSLIAREARETAAWIESHPHQSYRYHIYRIDVACDIRFSGYQAGTDFLFAEEGTDTSYSLTFSIQKQ